MGQDEKLERVLQRAALKLSLLDSQVEIPGSAGLHLRMNVERVVSSGQGLGWGSKRPENFERVHLVLEDGKGEYLAGRISRAYPGGSVSNPAKRNEILEGLVSRIVSGGSRDWSVGVKQGSEMPKLHPPLAEVLVKRAGKLEAEVVRMREEAAKLPEMERDLRDAQVAAGWVAMIGDEKEGLGV